VTNRAKAKFVTLIFLHSRSLLRSDPG